jgi:outer membrane murein-binding lipoprotein Lpp
MSRIHTPAMSRMQNFARNPVMIALVAGLALAGCANKKNLPNSAGDLGLGAGAATPGSAQDFTVNVGDRIFFDTDSTSIRADASLRRSTVRLSGSVVIRTMRSRLKAMPTNAARANTTLRSAPAVPLPPRTISLRAACPPSA